MDPSQMRYDFFISYGRGDDLAFTEQLYRDLTNEGFVVWFDKHALESNGLSFLQNIRDSLAAEQLRILLIAGPHSYQSVYVKYELEFALLNCLVIVPLLRKGFDESDRVGGKARDDYDLIPECLKKKNLHCIDFRPGRSYKSAYQELLKSISSSVRPLCQLHAVPNKPANFIPRHEKVMMIKEIIMADIYRPGIVSSVGRSTAVQGMGGIGKSVLAAAVCYDCDVRRSFSDGVYWITVGNINAAQNISGAIRQITNDEKIDIINNPGYAKAKVREFTSQKNCLLVLDDVWQQEDIVIFSSDEALRSRLLITTRNKQSVQHIAGTLVEVDLLNVTEARYLLLKAATEANFTGHYLPDKLPAEANEIIDECGYLPLAIDMAGGMIKQGNNDSWADVLSALKALDLEYFEQQFPEYPYPNLFRVLDASVNQLEDRLKEMYLQLAVFPADINIPADIIFILWKKDGFEKRHANKALDQLYARSLIQKNDDGHWYLHDLQADYIKKVCTNIGQLHKTLTNNFDNPFSLTHLYAWNNYIWHLKEAGEPDAAAALLQNFDWIANKIKATDIISLLKDYQHFSLNIDCDLIYRALKLSAHVLIESPDQLCAQLLGRLNAFTNQPIKLLLDKAAKWDKHPWLKPVKQSLTPPGSLLRRMKGHEWGINCLQLQNNKIITAANDKTIRIWDFESGECIRIFEGHVGYVTTIVVTADKIVSCSKDEYGGKAIDLQIRIWDVTTGQCLRILEGHTGTIRYLDVHQNKIISGSVDESIRIWDMESGECLYILTGIEFHSILILDDKIICSTVDNTVRVWEIDSGNCIKEIRDSTEKVWKLVHHDGKIIGVSNKNHFSEDDIIKVWDFESGRLLYLLQEHSSNIRSIDLHKNRIISCAEDHTIRIWDLQTGNCLHTLKRGRGQFAKVIINNKSIICGDLDAVYAWDIQTGKLTGKYFGHTKDITTVHVYKEKLIASSWDGTLHIWNINSCECERVFTSHTYITNVLISGNKIIAGSGDSIYIWEIEPAEYNARYDAHIGSVTSIALKDGMVVTGSGDYTLKVWELETGNCTGTIKGHSSEIASVIIRDDDIVSQSADSVRTWDIRTLQPRLNFGEHPKKITAFLLLKDKVITGSGDGTTRIWDLTLGQCLHNLIAKTGYISLLLTTKEKLITASADRTISFVQDSGIRIWDLQTGECLYQLHGRTGGVRCMVVYNNIIIAGAANGNVKVWDLQTGNILPEFEVQATGMSLHDNKLIIVSKKEIGLWDIESRKRLQIFEAAEPFLTDDEYLFCNSLDYTDTILVIDLKTGMQLQQLTGHKDSLCHLLIAQGLLLSADKSGLLLVHNMKDFSLLTKYYADAEIITPAVVADKRILFGDKSGRLHILEMKF